MPASRYRSPERLYHGVAYYPELWPRDQVATDITEMLRVGINVVRIGEFAWSKMEPDEGAIDLTFFKDAMDQLHAAGLRVVLCTPTATPPIWLTHDHPERCYVTADGYTMPHGGRQHACYENGEFRRYAARIVEAMTRALGQHPALLAWQLDNEFKCHVTEDFNKSTVVRWHIWLQKRYGTIAVLNQAWGTDIWSERYQRFQQILPPGRTPFQQNTSLATAYKLFSREMIAEAADEQATIIRRYSSVPITTNATLTFAISQERMFQKLDFAAFDDYPGHADWTRQVLNSDVYRNAVPGKPFWCMETSVAFNGWVGCNPEATHPPGFLVSEAVVIYALGGEAISYWLWRQQRSGVEQPHSAVLSSWGAPSLGYPEVLRVEQARRELEPLMLESVPAPAEIGLTWSDRGRVMLQVEPLGAGNGVTVSYEQTWLPWHKLVVTEGYHRDVRFEGADFSDLKLLITPVMPAISTDFLEHIRAWVEAGGVWLAGPLVGYRTEEHTVHLDAALGALESLAGVITVYAYPANGSKVCGEAFGESADVAGWVHALRPADLDTRVLGTLRSGNHDTGLAFVTERTLGRGRVVLFTAETQGESGVRLRTRLLHHCAELAGVTSRFEVTSGTLVAPRVTHSGDALWVVQNLDGRGGRVTLPRAAADAVSGETVPAGPLDLGAYAYRALRV